MPQSRASEDERSRDHGEAVGAFRKRVLRGSPTGPLRQPAEIGIGIMDRTEDAALLLDAMAYVEEVHRELTAENTAPPPGVEGRVVEAILADPALSQRVRDWATENRTLEASLTPLQRPTMDEVYRRVRDLLIAAAGKPG
jgi:hypothetical protein